MGLGGAGYRYQMVLYHFKMPPPHYLLSKFLRIVGIQYKNLATEGSVSCNSTGESK